MWGEDRMSWSWLGGMTVAAMLSILATAPARADCYCSRNPYSNLRECGEVLQKNEFVVQLRREGFPSDIGPLVLDLAKFTYCENQQRQGPVERAGPVPSRTDESFGIEGSNTIGEELMPHLIAGLAEREGLQIEGSNECIGRITLRPAKSGAGAVPETSIDCKALGTHFGIPALRKGLADIAMLSRPITSEEQKMMRAANEPVDDHVLALDGVVVIVSRSNPATALTLDQIARIFVGEITDWSQLGLPAGSINLYIRNENSGTRDTFERLVMRGRKFAPTDHQYSSSSELSAKVAADPHGIGFIGYAYRHDAKALDIRQSCGVTHRATDTAVKSEDYPLVRRLFLYTSEPHSKLAKRLVSYALSDQAQSVIATAHFINLSISEETAEEGRDRISRYGDPKFRPAEPELEFEPAVFGQLQRSTKGAQRLSISFRFGSDQATLDSRAQEDIRRLSRYLGAEDNRRALLAGFTDARGTFAYNLGLSQRRAAEVLGALVRNGVDRRRLTADGFSELLPVSCNSDDDNRGKNRRVEVWLLP
jgi:phosphate transport system substrate-binding protein